MRWGVVRTTREVRQLLACIDGVGAENDVREELPVQDDGDTSLTDRMGCVCACARKINMEWKQ